MSTSGGPAFLVAIMTGLAGPFVSLAGVYTLRRAEEEGRSPTPGRALVVSGMAGIALLMGMMFWTIIGPIIALGLVVFWALKIREWSRPAP